LALDWTASLHGDPMAVLPQLAMIIFIRGFNPQISA